MKIYYTYKQMSLKERGSFSEENLQKALRCYLIGRKADFPQRQDVFSEENVRQRQDAVFEIEKDSRGKPRMKNPTDIEFSVTHTGDWWICVIDDGLGGPLGIDAELKSRTVRRPDSLAKRFFHPKEAQYVSSGQQLREKNRRFLEIWVRKEAYLKYTGEGLTGSMTEVNVLQMPDVEFIPVRLPEKDANLKIMVCRKKSGNEEEMELCRMM